MRQRNIRNSRFEQLHKGCQRDRDHGGILCDIADAAMGMAFASTLAPKESFTTVELKINFFRPVWEAHLKAEGKVVRRGQSLGYVECEITDERDRLVAKAASTCLVLRGEDAKGR